MSSTIIVATISALSSIVVGGLSLVGVVVSNNKANNKMMAENQTTQAVMQERIDELTREVREHNNFAVKIPVIEQRIKALEKSVYNKKGS